MFTRPLRRDLLNAFAAKLSSNDVVVIQATQPPEPAVFPGHRLGEGACCGDRLGVGSLSPSPNPRKCMKESRS